MNQPLAALDPTWAWSPWEPTPEAPFDRRAAAHLFRRAGFGATTAELDLAVKSGPAATVAALFAETPESTAFQQETDQLAHTVLATGNPERLSSWWLYRMLGTPDSCREKTTLFWHGHFATSAAKVTEPHMMLAQYNLLREHAWSPFEPLVQEMSKNPAMLIWLDSTTNRKTHPNENYAREVMELFCLGTGNYTEQDIQQVARAFTGWEIQRGRYRFDRFQHDYGSKTILGRTGKFDGTEAVKIILEQPAAPRFIASKLFRFYLMDEPEPPTELIEPLAHQLRENGFRTGPLLETLFASNLFFSAHAMGRQIRSPVELGVGLLRSLEGTTNVYRLADQLASLGQNVFFPPNVKGWDGGRTWINSSTLLGRANLVRELVRSGESRFAADAGLSDVADRAGVETPDQVVDWLLELLVAVPVPQPAREPLVVLASERSSDRNQQVARVVQAIGALPEFQLL